MCPGFCLPTLEDCSELREIVLASSPPISYDLSLILSVTSTNIRKIELEYWPLSSCPSLIDTALSHLVDRLRASGYEHTLELEFRFGPGSAEIHFDADLKESFPHFRERGLVTVIDAMGGKMLHSSDW